MLYPVPENLKAVATDFLPAHGHDHLESAIGLKLWSFEAQLVNDRSLIAVVHEDRHRRRDELTFGSLNVVEKDFELGVADRLD